MEGKKKTNHDFEFIGRVIDILLILQKKTDEHTTITQPQILRELDKNGHTCSARTLTDYLKMIMRKLNPEDGDGNVEPNKTIHDYRIIAKGLEKKLEDRDNGMPDGRKKLQLRSLKYNHLFSFQELNQLIEAVLFLDSIKDSKKEDLIKKIQRLSSENYKKYSPYLSQNTGKLLQNLVGGYKNSRIDKDVVEENLKMIREALEYKNGRGCKISFYFNGYNEKKQLMPRRNKDGSLMTYVVNPYYIVLYHNKYYLICSKEPHKNVSIYRIDLMSHITSKTGISKLDGKTVESENRVIKNEIEGLPQKWDGAEASKFLAQHLYMFYGNPENITIKIDRERYTLLHDYFGNNYEFKEHLDETWDRVRVQCVPEAMVVWAMQCSDYVEVLAPEPLRKKIQEKCKKLVERYQ